MSSNATSSSIPTATYKGSCHCDRFKFAVKQSPPLTDPEASVTECNCSICSRNGYLLIYVDDSAVSFEKGTLDEFSRHTSANGKYGHYFCPSCGTSCFAGALDPEDPWAKMKAVNVRTFQDIDLKSLKVNQVDGKSR